MKKILQLVIGRLLIASLIKLSLVVEQRTKYYKVQKSIAMISVLINFQLKVGFGVMEKWELQDIVPIMQMMTPLNYLAKIKKSIYQIQNLRQRSVSSVKANSLFALFTSTFYFLQKTPDPRFVPCITLL